MKPELLKVYYKAAVWPPFYTASIPGLIILLWKFFNNGFNFSVLVEDSIFVHEFLRVAVNSGIIGLAAGSLFLNTYRTVACNKLYSLVSWFLLPLIAVAIILSKIDWDVINHPGHPSILYVTFMLVICFFNCIGLVISYIDFRTSVLLQLQEDEKTEAAMRRSYHQQLQD